MANTSIFDNNWVNLVFEGRNQQYGAFVLRKKSSNYTIKGIIFSIIGFSLAIAAPVIINYLKQQIPKENIVVEAEVTKLDAPPPMDESTPPPPPPPPPSSPSLSREHSTGSALSGPAASTSGCRKRARSEAVRMSAHNKADSSNRAAEARD